MTHSDGTSSYPILILTAVALIGMVVYRIMAMRKRTREMSEMAGRVGLRPCPDGTLPLDLSLDGTVFRSWSRLSNIFEGRPNGKEVVVLDFMKRRGRSSWSRTIIATRTHDPLFDRSAFKLTAEQVGEWQLVYSRVGFFKNSRLMDTGEVENLLRGIERS